MAGKNQVVLTFAADDKSLERTLKGVGDQARKTEQDFDRLGDGVGRTSDRLRKSSKDVDHHASRLDAAGESADTAETRFTGLASGIDGVTTLMADPSPQEFAQGIADISDGLANSAVPALTKARDGLSSLIERMGGAKNAALAAGGIAGVGALAAGLIALDRANHAAKIEKITDSLKEFNGGVNESTSHGVLLANMFGDLDGIMSDLIATSPEVAANILDNADAFKISKEDAAQYRLELAEVQGTAESAAFEISALNDALLAGTDPVFAAINAQNGLRDAQRELNAAIKEHGEGSAQAAEASVAAAEAGTEYMSALLGLQEAVESGDVSSKDFKATLGLLKAQTGLNSDAAQVLADKFLGVTERAKGVPKSVSSAISADDRATGVITNVGNRLFDLDGRSATVQLNALTNFGASIGSLFAADGAIVPQYLAAGGFGGPRGTDTVPAWLTPGEMVLNDAQQANLWAMANGRGGGNGGPTFIFNGPVAGEREFERMMRDAFERGGFEGLVRR